MSKNSESVKRLAFSEGIGSGIVNALVNPAVALLFYPSLPDLILADLLSDTFITCFVISVCVWLISPLCAKVKIEAITKKNFDSLSTKKFPRANILRGIVCGTILGTFFCVSYAFAFKIFEMQSIPFLAFELIKAFYAGIIGFFAGYFAISANAQ